MNCCGAIFTLKSVPRKEGDETVLHELSRRRCGKKVSRFFKVSFKKTAYHPEFEPEFVTIYSLCDSCAKAAPGIFTDKCKIPDSVYDWSKLARKFDMLVRIPDTNLLYGCSGGISSIEECDQYQEKILHQEREMLAVKNQLKAVIKEMELRLHVADPAIWKFIFDEVVNELVIEGVMKS